MWSFCEYIIFIYLKLDMWTVHFFFHRTYKQILHFHSKTISNERFYMIRILKSRKKHLITIQCLKLTNVNVGFYWKKSVRENSRWDIKRKEKKTYAWEGVTGYIKVEEK